MASHTTPRRPYPCTRSALLHNTPLHKQPCTTGQPTQAAGGDGTCTSRLRSTSLNHCTALLHTASRRAHLNLCPGFHASRFAGCSASGPSHRIPPLIITARPWMPVLFLCASTMLGRAKANLFSSSQSRLILSSILLPQTDESETSAHANARSKLAHRCYTEQAFPIPKPTSDGSPPRLLLAPPGSS